LFIIVPIISSTVVNVTQFDNFTIEWETFSIFTCVAPATVNISRFTCSAGAQTLQVEDISCLNETTVDFDQYTCQSTTTESLYTSNAPITTEQPTTITTTTTTTTTTATHGWMDGWIGQG